MSDFALTIAAATIEIGVSAIVLFGSFKGSWRSKAVVIAGALTPAIAFMLYLAYGQFTAPSEGNMAIAGWVMGFLGFVVLLVAGIALSFVSRPASLPLRYLLGLAASGIVLALFSMR